MIATLDTILEAVDLAQRRRTLQPLERRLQGSMARAFRSQGTAFLRRLVGLRSRYQPIQEAAAESEWGPLFEQAEVDTLSLFTEPFTPIAEAALLAGVRAVVADLGVELSFDLANPRAVAYLRDHAATRVTGINEETRRQLRTILTRSVDEGWSYQRTAREISAKYRSFAVGSPLKHIRSRAELIAVTEVGDAYEAGQMAAAQEMQQDGLRMQKAWRDVGDSRVDPKCRANTGAGWIDLHSAFPSGAQRPLDHPGCRCVLLLRAKPDME